MRVSSSADTVCVTTLCDVTDAESRSARLPVSLTFSRVDPLAVRLTLGGSGKALEWVFALDLLREGVSRHSGVGSVSVWPSALMRDRPEVSVYLSSGLRSAHLRLPREAVTCFLDGLAALPPLDFDGLVERELSDLIGRERKG